MNRNSLAWSIAYGAAAVALCTGITAAGCGLALSNAQEPAFPVPAAPAPVLAIRAEEPAISSADLWSADRDRMDAPLLGVGLDAETQWAIFEQCGQDTELFCAVMAIAAVESDFTTDLIGDGGDSIGMMQINTRWHTGRMAALGVTDLTDPVQCVAVAIDYLTELEGTMQAGPGDHPTLMAYNCGPDSAKRKIRSGITANEYSTAVTAAYLEYIAEIGVLE